MLFLVIKKMTYKEALDEAVIYGWAIEILGIPGVFMAVQDKPLVKKAINDAGLYRYLCFYEED